MARGCPEDCSMNRERHAQAAQTSRMRVEMDMVEEWCRAFEPKFYSSPNRTGDHIDGIESVSYTHLTLPTKRIV